MARGPSFRLDEHDRAHRHHACATPATAAVSPSGCCAVALAVGPAAQAQTQSPAPAAKNRFQGEPVTLNFVNADIEGVTRAVGAILKKQFVVDPRVRGTITLYSDQPLTPREVYLNYLAALRGLGFTVVEVGGLFKVVPEADAKLQTGTVAVETPTRQGDQVLTQVFRLNHENANNLVAVLRPLISPNNTINANPGNNSLVITDYADNLQRIAKIIAAMDVPSSGDVEVIPLQNAVAADLAVIVQRLADSGSAPGAAPGAAAPLIMVDRAQQLAHRARRQSGAARADPLARRQARPARRLEQRHGQHLGRLPEERRRREARRRAACGVQRPGFEQRRRRRVAHTPACCACGECTGRCAGGRTRRREPGDDARLGLGRPLHRRLHPGRPVDQLAHHHRQPAAVPAVAQRDRQARFAPRAGLHRVADREGGRREDGRHRHPVAGHLGRPEQQHERRRRHELQRQPATSSTSTAAANEGADGARHARGAAGARTSAS